uniref:Deoxynucleotidyltransferase, terminal, interacting protein 2 n=1 Tax=Labrus bergylta TaxID=56723 RepID=A0A3Q3ENB9_9LABR|nr:deoxynucleotidyltransferase terminal-interacting protein 2 [Labrus bergylta]
MVATRRGVRVCSPSKTTTDMSSDVQATPSRRTRSTAKQEESPTHNALVETSSHLEKYEGEPQASPPTSSMKRCSRASRLHSPDQPCTPVGSVHEADQSEMESCCSAVSDSEPPMTRTRQRKRAPRAVRQEDEDISEVESCSSVVSALKAGQSVRRSTRRKPTRTDPDQVKVGDVKVDVVPESESGSFVVSESQKITRSQRKTRSRSSAKQTEDSELSDAESCTSNVSEVSKTRRSRRQIGCIPIHLNAASGSSPSPALRTLRTRVARSKASDVSEPPSCDSEGFESGSSHGMATRRRGKPGPKIVDSDSEPSDVYAPLGSPCSTRSRGTPCSSRTGSGSSSRGALSSRHTIKDLSVVLEKAAEPAEEDTSFSGSMLESTVISVDGDQTLLEEDEAQTLEEKEAVNADLTSEEADVARVEAKVKVIPEEGSLLSEEAACKPAVTVGHQQEEPCAESKHEDNSEMETMEQIKPPSEQSEPSVTVTSDERTPEITEETEDKDNAADVDDHSSQADEAVEVETRPREEEEEGEEGEEKMEVSTLNRDDQQVVDSCEVDFIQVTSNEQHKITVDCVPEEKPNDVTVQKTKVISLLESSEDEDESAEEEEEEREISEMEDLECRPEERSGPSKSSDTAGPSVEGLFMIDTRPGEEADELYLKGRPTEDEEEKATKAEGAKQEEQDEEFVDEEGDDDDDEDAMILFSSKNQHVKEMSSRIDPGIRVKDLGGLYINFDGSKSKPVSNSLQKLKGKKMQDEVMKKSVIGPEFEKKDAVPPYSESKQALKLKHRVEREKSTGDSWFNMKAPEITPELKGDLNVLKMRGSMDPKRFYKKNDRDGFPKYFQVGTVVDNPVDFYHSRLPKKARKRTMVEELMADADFRHKNKKKYQDIVAEKAARGAGRRHKKNKFHKKSK